MSSDSEQDVRSPWVATDDRKKEIEPRERELFARAQKEKESKTDTTSEWTTRDLVVLIRASRSDRLASRRTKAFAKAKLAALWSFDLSSLSLPSLSPLPLPGAIDALSAGSATSPCFLFFRLFMAREVVLGEWRAFVTVRPGVLRGPCPSPSASVSVSESTGASARGTRARAGGAVDQCSAARRRRARDWSETVGEEMVSEAHRYDPICALDVLRETVVGWAEDGVCKGCVERLKEMCDRKKAELWKTLENWLEDAEYSDEDEQAREEITPWSTVWPEWDSGDEVPVVEEKKRKVEEDGDGDGDGDGDVKVEEGEDPLLVKALAANAKRRKKVKVEAASKNVLHSDAIGEASGSGTKIKQEEFATAKRLESGEGKSRKNNKGKQAAKPEQGGKGGRGGKVGGKAMDRAINSIIDQRISDNKVKGGPGGRGTQNGKGRKSRSG